MAEDKQTSVIEQAAISQAVPYPPLQTTPQLPSVTADSDLPHHVHPNSSRFSVIACDGQEPIAQYFISSRKDLVEGLDAVFLLYFRITSHAPSRGPQEQRKSLHRNHSTAGH